MSKRITLDILSARLDCKLKAHLLLNGLHGQKSDYESATCERRSEMECLAILKAAEQYPSRSLLNAVPLTRSVLAQGVPFILGAELPDDGVSIQFHALKKVDGPSRLGSFHYVPVLLFEGRGILRKQRLLIEVSDLMLAKL